MTLNRIPAGVWTQIRRIMHNNGGKWCSKGYFEFDRDATAFFDGLLKGMIANRKKDRQDFPTPAALARIMVDLASVKGKHVLEPSAGHGALADACRAAGAQSITCYDSDRTAFEALRDKGYSASHCDFLEMLSLPSYERVVMNPPFAKGAFRKHIKHALGCLRKGGLLVSIIPGDQVDPLLKKIIGKRRFVCKVNMAGMFKESGTNVQTSILVVENK
jgi:hypothetical protein